METLDVIRLNPYWKQEQTLRQAQGKSRYITHSGAWPELVEGKSSSLDPESNLRAHNNLLCARPSIKIPFFVLWEGLDR